MSYVNVNVAKPGSNLGRGGDKKALITIFDMDDVLTYPARDSKGVVVTDNIQFNPGAYMITVYGSQDTIKFSSSVEGDPDKEGVIQEFSFEHPGDEVAIREFRANWMSKNIGIIQERCSTSKKNLFGTPCAPLRLQFKAEDDKDKTITTLSFKSSQKGPDYADYQGTMSYDTVKDTVAADATTVDVTNGEGEYQLTTGTSAAAALTALTNCADGKVYTLLGSGGSHPSTIAASGNWLLKNGTSWSALAGATITFKAFKDGSSSFKFLELSRA